MDAFVAGIAYHLPDTVVTNRMLNEEYADWDVDRITSKTGIRERRIAAPGETASDLGFTAATKLLDGMQVDRSTIDVLLLCTQSPDFALPATSCVLQDRLGLPTTCAALDFNQGCSGFIYGLYLAKALVTAGMARQVLLVTAETYSRYIHPADRSVRVLFGDGAAATLIGAGPHGARIGEIVLGTDGSGHDRLIVPAGGARRPASAETAIESVDENGSIRTPAHLYMDGPALFNFTLKRVPEVVEQLLQRTGVQRTDVQWFAMHQANAFMNKHLRVKLGLPADRTPMAFENCGNTVSSTIPIVLHEFGAKFQPGDRVMAIGFGVGFSWGAALLEWGSVRLV